MININLIQTLIFFIFRVLYTQLLHHFTFFGSILDDFVFYCMFICFLRHENMFYNYKNVNISLCDCQINYIIPTTKFNNCNF